MSCPAVSLRCCSVPESFTSGTSDSSQFEGKKYYAGLANGEEIGLMMPF
jgi:hypothetical protein